MKITVIIPARYASTRLPGKPLLEIGGRPMILHVVNQAEKVTTINRVMVATDDERVYKVVTKAGKEAVMTSPDHTSGTDRLAEVAASLQTDIIVNIQGDEPFIEPATIEAAIAPLISNSQIVMATTSEPIESAADLLNPSVVKVVTDNEGFALYFSRSPIPFPRSEVLKYGSLEAALQAAPELLQRFSKHTGLYVYRRDFLLKFASLSPTSLEQLESLEQLRVLAHGWRIQVIKVAHRSLGIDTPEDLERARKILNDR
jgi:3-deoxy-manno-octulosonate cytidylyltransferase (CMP-KDO synthetase)